MMYKLFYTLVLTFAVYYLQAQVTVGMLYKNSAATDGYTLFNPNHSDTTYLIDNCGRVVNKWAGSTRPGLSVYLLEDGTLLRTGKASSPAISFGGVGGYVEKLDWNGNLLWSYTFSTSDGVQHHDVEPLANGNLLVLITKKHSYFELQNIGYQGIQSMPTSTEVWAETVQEIRPVGTDSLEVVWEWDSWNHLIQDVDSQQLNYGVVANHPEKIDLNYIPQPEGDWMHANSVAYNAELDQIMLSVRAFDEIWIVDHSTTTAEAATFSGGNYGKGGSLLYRWGNPLTYKTGSNSTDVHLEGQHDARWIPKGYPKEGQIMIFNNGSDRLYSSVDIISPPLDTTAKQYTMAAGQPFAPQNYWSFSHGQATDFYHDKISGAHPLPNGNILMTGGPQGIFIEIDSMKDTTWIYQNPLRSTGAYSQNATGTLRGTNVFRATKYPSNYVAFNGKNMTPGSVLEINYQVNNCALLTDVKDLDKMEVSVYPNPVQRRLTVDFGERSIQSLTLVNLQGQVLLQEDIEGEAFIEVELSHIPNGLYYLLLDGQVVKKIRVLH